MKRIICLFLFLCFLPVACFAELDLSGFTLEQLYYLQKAVSQEILNRSQWQHVEVPQGYYVVGEDIPEGHWTITAAPGSYCMIEYFLNADASGHRPADTFDDYFYIGLYSEGSNAPSTIENKSIDIDLKAGYHFVVNYGPCVFEPFTGRYSPFF